MGKRLFLYALFCFVIVQFNFAADYYKGTAGKGIRIAVPAPVLVSDDSSDVWLPQFFQDVITGDLSTYSAMTVVDRQNEALVKEEQRLSESNLYDEATAVQIGKMTQASHILTGNIINMGGNKYSISFRVNNLETNVIESSFNGVYTRSDIESAYCIKECVKAILQGLGVQLTKEGEQSLSANATSKTNATQSLAKAMAAETKQNNIVQAIAYYNQAILSDSNLAEAQKRLDSLNNCVQTGKLTANIKNDIAYRKEWIKVFNDLNNYLIDNCMSFVYYLDGYETAIDYQNETVHLKFKTETYSNKIARDLIAEIIQGLINTGKYKEWGADNFIIDDNCYKITLSLHNSNGKTIGTCDTYAYSNVYHEYIQYQRLLESYQYVQNSYSTFEEYLFTNMDPSIYYGIRNNDQGYIMFRDILIDDITDELSISVDNVCLYDNNVPAKIGVYESNDWYEIQNLLLTNVQNSGVVYKKGDRGPTGGLIIYAGKSQKNGKLLNGQKYRYIEINTEPVMLKVTESDIEFLQQATKLCKDNEEQFTGMVLNHFGIASDYYKKYGDQWYIGFDSIYPEINSSFMPIMSLYNFSRELRNIPFITASGNYRLFEYNSWSGAEDFKKIAYNKYDLKQSDNYIYIIFVRGFN